MGPRSPARCGLANSLSSGPSCSLPLVRWFACLSTLPEQPSARSIYRQKKEKRTESYHGGCFFVIAFRPTGLCGKSHTRGQRRSVEVTLRPGFELQLRAGDQLCSVKAGQTRADTGSWRWRGRGDRGGAGIWDFALLEGTLDEDGTNNILERGIRPTGKKRKNNRLPRRWMIVEGW
ncbi:hypothetical protein GGI43DRAFT_291403 [Trichoderma evansii]